MKTDILNVKDAVVLVLEQDERARSDDKWLIKKVLDEMGIKVYIPFDKFKTMPSFESITRCRRKIQEAGHYPPIKKTWEYRKIEQDDMEDIHTWF